MFDLTAETPLTTFDPRLNAFKYFHLDLEVVIISDSSFNHIQGEMDYE